MFQLTDQIQWHRSAWKMMKMMMLMMKNISVCVSVNSMEWKRFINSLFVTNAHIFPFRIKWKAKDDKMHTQRENTNRIIYLSVLWCMVVCALLVRSSPKPQRTNRHQYHKCNGMCTVRICRCTTHTQTHHSIVKYVLFLLILFLLCVGVHSTHSSAVLILKVR